MNTHNDKVKSGKSQLRQDFQRFLEVGAYCTPPGKAACALRAAKILRQWREAESAGLVRIGVEQEQESFADVYGRDQEKKEWEFIERYGVWYVFTEVNHGSEASGDDWQLADGVGMCVYRDPVNPFENCYVIDLMSEALDRIPQSGNVDELCTAL